MKHKKVATAAIATIISASAVMATTQAIAASNSMEKCYGVAKAGMNDCGGPGTGHSCQGQSKKNADKNDWLYVPKGTCNKIVGASITRGQS